MVKTKNARLAVRLPADLKKRLAAKADQAEKTLASYVAAHLEEHHPAPKKKTKRK